MLLEAIFYHFYAEVAKRAGITNVLEMFLALEYSSKGPVKNAVYDQQDTNTKKIDNF